MRLLGYVGLSLIFFFFAYSSRAENMEGEKKGKNSTRQDSIGREINALSEVASKVTQWGVQTGTSAANAAVTALRTVVNAFMRPEKNQESRRQDNQKPLTVYSPAETNVVCAACGQQTLIRGNLPGLVIYCPSCGKPLPK